jgi:hypothetical protein
MAIKFLHDLDLSGQELKNVKMHVTGTAPTAAAGAFYYDSGDHKLKYYSAETGNTGFKTLSTDVSDDNTVFSQSVVDSSGILLRLTGTPTTGSNTTDDIKFSGAGTVTVSRASDAEITITGSAPSAASATGAGTIKLFSSTVQAVNAAADPTSVNGRTYGLQVDSNGKGVINVPWTDTHQLTNEEVQDIVGGMVTGGTESGVSVTYTDGGVGAGKLNFSVASQTANDFTNILKTKLDNITANATPTDTANVKTALNASFGGAGTIGDASDTFTIPGNLIVSGTQTVQNETVQVVENNTIQFEGTSADDHEVKLTAANATTSDKTITLPNLSGHVALLASAAGGTISATPAEINKIDGFTGDHNDLNYAKDLRATGVTSTEFDYLDGVTSNIQTQLGNKQASGTYNTQIGTDTDIDTSGVDVIDTLTMTDGVITAHATRTLPTADASTLGVTKLANATEAIAGVEASKVLTPDTLAARSVHSTIDVSNSSFVSGKKAAIVHDLGTEDVLVEMFDSSTKETVIGLIERKTFAGAASTSTIRISFNVVPDNDIEVIISSTRGATAKTAVYA